MCVEDNAIVFEVSSKEDVKIPHMKICDLKDILFKKLRLDKACDVFMLTVEHPRNAGDPTLVMLDLLNLILDNLNYLSSPPINIPVHKSKDRPVMHHKSYRQVRVIV